MIKTFNQISKLDTNIAGGKGASLGEMTKAKIPVPPGFVILSTTFDKFIEINALEEKINSLLNPPTGGKPKDIKTVEKASKEIQSLILKSKIPEDIAKEIEKYFKNLKAKYVAVRSSATAEDSSSAAWAGQLESYLNTTKDDLLDNVKKCWASLFTPRAISYRFEQIRQLADHKQKISVAVVVQKMVESKISGIAFTVHPVTQNKNQMIVEAGYGLGEAIVGGMITPDSYVVNKNFKIEDINTSTQEQMIVRGKSGGVEWKKIDKTKQSKQKLTKTEIIKLAKLCKKIEDHYKFPCDIEWAVEKNKFYIVQSRPITTLK